MSVSNRLSQFDKHSLPTFVTNAHDHYQKPNQSLVPSYPDGKSREVSCISSALLESLWERNKEINSFTVRQKTAFDELLISPNHPFPYCYKKTQDFLFHIIIKAIDKSKSAIHPDLLHPPAVLPTQDPVFSRFQLDLIHCSIFISS